ncbi:Unsaturated rhamnogalacturonyl hydrolase YesR [Hypsizygus marmoreus]|uniref:Unsaturated rhamnogalacturonyl hydrolase YesR n=1 Tax=Hypsizygus marmoreus TaxID=39966 RepID=A0A369JB44_HYPMA|nr:Unsaturated rhamnogalacturonyl hydrolase YesR [Hypsizygus marmoreus]
MMFGLVNIPFVLGSLSSTVLAANSNPFLFNPGFDIAKVADLAESIPSHSWEYGAAAEALLELYDPAISVFGRSPFPVPTVQKEDVKALSYAADRIIIGTGPDALSKGDGAVGDPASLGVSAILLGKTNQTFADAAVEQLNFVVDSAPRYSNGAISHRVDVPELWADFVYMAPPFIAYYAADTNNASLLYETVKQCGYYREVLQADLDTSYRGIWHHIIGPQSQDLGLWSTGNGWAAGGMARVLATVMKAPVARLAGWRREAIDNLTQWIKEIVDGAIGSPTDAGLLRNYLDDETTGHGFGEVAGTSMIASVIYRMAVLQPRTFGAEYIKWADDVRTLLGGNDAEGNPHVTDSGIVTPAVNPLNWYDTNPLTTGSPEGQGFVVLMYAAWRDCILAGKCKRRGSRIYQV